MDNDVKKAVAITSFAELVAGSTVSLAYIGMGLIKPPPIYPLTLSALISASLTTATVRS